MKLTMKEYQRALEATLNMIEDMLSSRYGCLNTPESAKADRWLEVCRHALEEAKQIP